MNTLTTRLRKIADRIQVNPRALVLELSRRVRGEVMQTIVARQTFEDAIECLKKNSTIAAFTDNPSDIERLRELGFQVSWISDHSESLGAVSTKDFIEHPLPAGFFVSGSEVAKSYNFVLQTLHSRKTILPVAWVANNFEFSGSTIPIPKEIDDAHFYLFNHFQDMFGVKDVLKVQVRIQLEEGETIQQEFLLSPKSTLFLKLSEWLPMADRKSALVVEFRCSHPELSRGRHNRWRVWADVFHKGSIASLHGAHDYGPSHWCESRMAPPELVEGEVAITFPNYSRDLSLTESTLKWGVGRTWHSDRRSRLAPVTSRNWKVDPKTKDQIQYHFYGHGDCFWFNFGPRNGGARLVANHQVSVDSAEFPQPMTAEIRERMKEIVKPGFILHPHFIPMSNADDEVQWGFGFGSANPRFNDYVFHFFGRDGKLLSIKKWHQQKAGVIWTRDLKTLEPAASAMIFSPDWEMTNSNPQRINYFGHLYAMDKNSTDLDATEFQNCWRNNGVIIDEFPHWIHPSKAIKSRTHLVGRVVSPNFGRTLLLLAFGSGNLNINKTCEATIELIAFDGRSISRPIKLSSLTHVCVYMDELFPEFTEFLKDEGAALRISCGEADLNAQIVTRAKGAMSLQHLWGY